MRPLITSLCCFTFLFTSLWGQTSIVFNREGNVWQDEIDSGVGQIYDMIDQLKGKMNSLPPTVERVAFHQIRIDQREFSPGIARYIQGLIEESFKTEGRKAVISSPDLKTTKIVVTDTTFEMSNALPDAEALWSLGNKLRVDAFIQGSVSKSEDGDLLLHLNLIQQKTAEVIWSANIIAGPNRKKARPFNLEYLVGVGWKYWAMNRFIEDTLTVNGGLTLYHYTLDLGLLQTIGTSQRLQVMMVAGAGVLTPVPDASTDTRFDTFDSKFEMHAGVDIIGVLIPKHTPEYGYWLGMFVGGRAQFPNSLVSIDAGYLSRLTPNLALSAGIHFYPFQPVIRSGLFGITENLVEMEPIAYEAKAYYHF